MERKIEADFLKWKQNEKPRPMILIGARQVGKTYTALQFGKKEYETVVYFNFEDNEELMHIFDTTAGIENIVQQLSKLSNTLICEKTTLIVFDEIQLYEKLLPILKYFYDSPKNYHIIAIGTYYEPITNTKKYTYPVGSVELKTMYSMHYDEYLLAVGKESLLPYIYHAYDTNKPIPYHKLAMDLYEEYLLTGGYPMAVMAKIKNENVEAVNKTIHRIILADILKYTKQEETIKVKEAFEILPKQLVKKNKKYQYSLIKHGARSYEYDNAIDWMRQGGLVVKSIKLLEVKRPLSNYADKGNFKIYYRNIGLLSSKIGNQLAPLMENDIASTLSRNGYQLYFWESDGKASIDFVIYDKEGNIVPVDVKYPDIKSKSLSVYINKYHPTKVVRISCQNFSCKDGIKNIPVYATFCMKG